MKDHGYIVPCKHTAATQHKRAGLIHKLKPLNAGFSLLWILPLLACASVASSMNFQIRGVQNDVQKNIELRLTELFEQKSLQQETPQTLQHEVAQAMYPYGYFKPHITVRYGKTKKTLLIDVMPGPQMQISSLNIQVEGEGQFNPKIAKAARSLPLKLGQPFNNTDYEAAKERLLNAAEHAGYLRAAFSTSEVLIDKQRYTARIKLIFNTGQQFYFGQVKFDPTYLHPKFLHRYVPFHDGQPYSTDAVLDLESNLSASGYFKSVTVRPDIDRARRVPINIHMQQANRINYSLGIGYGTDTGPRGRAGVHIVPVNRSGHKFNAIAQGSLLQSALLAQYLIPGKNPVTDNYSLTARLSNLDYNIGNSNAFLLSLAQQHVTTNYQRVISINALNERYTYSGVPRTSKTVFYPQISLTWRHATDPLFSPSGYNITLTGFAAAKALLSDINTGQITGDAKAAFTVEPIRTRFYFHAIQGVTQISQINDLPLSLAMLLGGAENLKAYRFNSIGPGKIMSYAGIEIQKETVDKWYLLGFFDSGDVYQPSLKNFQYDAGIGLMWVSPIGPIKVSVAQAIHQDFSRVQGRNPKLVINMGPDL